MIKICGLRDVATAIYAAESGATAIGLVFSESPRRVTRVAAQAICEALADFEVERVGVFRAADLADLPGILESVALDAVQVHGLQQPPFTLYGLHLIPGGSTAEVAGLQHPRVLADSPLGAGSGATWDYREVAALAATRPVVLAGGLTPDNVAAAVEAVRPHGVDVSSGVESSRGVKDLGLIRAFIQQASHALQTGARP
jgi:phosphoribosylanthranilate isomerase